MTKETNQQPGPDSSHAPESSEDRVTESIHPNVGEFIKRWEVVNTLPPPPPAPKSDAEK